MFPSASGLRAGARGPAVAVSGPRRSSGQSRPVAEVGLGLSVSHQLDREGHRAGMSSVRVAVAPLSVRLYMDVHVPLAITEGSGCAASTCSRRSRMSPGSSGTLSCSIAPGRSVACSSRVTRNRGVSDAVLVSGDEDLRRVSRACACQGSGVACQGVGITSPLRDRADQGGRQAPCRPGRHGEEERPRLSRATTRPRTNRGDAKSEAASAQPRGAVGAANWPPAGILRCGG